LLGVRPASSAADISEYCGRPVFSAGRGEQEQSKRVRRRRGITAHPATNCPSIAILRLLKMWG